jgi:hypothetical protein
MLGSPVSPSHRDGRSMADRVGGDAMFIVTVQLAQRPA